MVTRRELLRLTPVVVAGLALPLLTRAAYAGSYLDRAALLLSEAGTDIQALRTKMTDEELVRVIHRIAEARVGAASDMDVPKAVVKAHPHLLLVMAKVERAAQAALDGSFTMVVELCDDARREESIFKKVLADLGFSLPSAP
ncbi:MAG: hypothetical protein U0271_27405 [Polyangiaceae bacterium]